MSKRVYITMSLDGYIAKEDGAVDWLVSQDGEDFGYMNFLSNTDTIVTGRSSFEMVESFGGWEGIYPGKKTWIFSKTMEKKRENKMIKIWDRGVASYRDQVEQDGDIWIFGGGQLIKGFLQNNLVDELIIAIQPIILGGGIPLFDAIGKEVPLKLVESKGYECGIVLSTYRIGEGNETE